MQAFPVMVRDTCYFERITRYIESFSPEQLHVLFLEDLVSDPSAELRKCFEHISVDPEFNPSGNPVQLNPGTSKYFDTRVYRQLRNRQSIREWIKRNESSSEKLSRFLRLRKPFRKPVVWDEGSISLLNNQIMPDTTRFLENYGKTPGYWRNPYADITPDFKLVSEDANDHKSSDLENFVPVPKPSLTIHNVSDGYLIYDDLGDRLHQINYAAGTVLSLCHDGRTCAEIASEIKQKFHLEYVPATEVVNVIAEFSHNNLLVNEKFENI